ncbi:MAG TPA: putative sugar nucleotidyl transferase, partial [Bacteroidia bacterium]|nr:putative sugar nucleotidyl transferase [Bacteroidia bacterium]
MNYILFDDKTVREHLLPLTFTRPVCDIRIGILTIREKWEHELGKAVSVKTEVYLSEKYPELVSKKDENILINGSVLPTKGLVNAIKKLKGNEALVSGNIVIAINGTKAKTIEWKGDTFMQLEKLWDIFAKNGQAIEDDFVRLTKGKRSAKASPTNTLIGKRIF